VPAKEFWKSADISWCYCHLKFVTNGNKLVTHKHKINSTRFIQQCLLTSVFLLHVNEKNHILRNNWLRSGNTRFRVERAVLVPWVGDPPDASLWFYLREAFQSQTTQKRYYTSTTRVARYWYVIRSEEQQLHNIIHWTEKLFLWWLVSFHPVVSASVIPSFSIWVVAEQKSSEVGEVTVLLAILKLAELNLHPRPCPQYSLFLCWNPIQCDLMGAGNPVCLHLKLYYIQTGKSGTLISQPTSCLTHSYVIEHAYPPKCIDCNKPLCQTHTNRMYFLWLNTT